MSLAYTAAAVTIGTTIYGADQANKAGKTNKKAAEATAAQYDKRAVEEQEVGGREAVEIKRQGEQIKSNANAAMAYSGGVTDDAGAYKTQGDISAVIDYNVLMAIYTGKKTAQQSREAADAVRKGGAAAASAAKAQANATLLSGASTAITQYHNWDK
jgi:hypothetical protein